MDTKANQERLARLTPEQRESVERIRARRSTPEHLAEVAAAQEQIRKEFPPLGADESLIELAARFRHERERQGLSLADMEERTGMGRGEISKLETGKIRNPTWTTLQNYAKALGLAIEWSVKVGV